MSEPSLAVLFDLDGTLVDSVADITASKNATLSQMGLPLVSEGEVHPWIGRPPIDFFRHLGLGDQAGKAVASFRAHLGKHVGARSTVYAGVPEAVGRLVDDGWRVAVATNKPTHLARITLERVGLLHLFPVILGADVLPPKPNPDLLWACLERVGCSSGVMVGDTVFDVIAGKAAALPTVLVCQHQEPDPQALIHEPDAVVMSFWDVPAAVTNVSTPGQ